MALLLSTQFASRIGLRHISVGTQIPNSVKNLKKVKNGEISATSVDELFKNKKVVLFGVPGAYTPVCSKDHLPGYVTRAAEIKGKGFDIVCLSVNDPFVLKAWAAEHKANDTVTFLADGNADLTKALNLSLDASAHALGIRCKRFAAVVDNGKVISVNVEDPPTGLTQSDACTISKAL